MRSLERRSSVFLLLAVLRRRTGRRPRKLAAASCKHLVKAICLLRAAKKKMLGTSTTEVQRPFVADFCILSPWTCYEKSQFPQYVHLSCTCGTLLGFQAPENTPDVKSVRKLCQRLRADTLNHKKNTVGSHPEIVVYEENQRTPI